MRIVCVTSCFTGIVYPYLAAEALQLAGEHLGHEIIIESQGSTGSGPLSAEEIERADGVIFAVDEPVVGRERFAGKPFVEGELASAIHAPHELIGRLVAEVSEGTAKLVEGEPTAVDSVATNSVTADALPPVTVTSDAVTLEVSTERGFFAKLFGRGRPS